MANQVLASKLKRKGGMCLDKKEQEVRCIRCGRKLKNPAARGKGLGRVCEKKLQYESQEVKTKKLP
jgi:DNA polymerase II large subunit